jgi:hypothetical protein
VYFLVHASAASDGGEDEDEDMEGHEARGDIGTDDDEVRIGVDHSANGSS